MNIYLSTKKRDDVIKLPVIPSEFTISSPSQNEKYSTITNGEINLLGPEGLKSIILDSFFPSKHYPFLKDKKFKGYTYVNKIEKWKSKKLPIRLIIVSNKKTVLNKLFAIESFEYGPRDGSGDVYYSLSLSEFKLLPLQKRKA